MIVPDLTDNGLSSYVQSSELDYRIKINGTKYIVSNGVLLQLDAESTKGYGAVADDANFISIGSPLLPIVSATKASILIRPDTSPHWYLLLGGTMYYLPTTDLLPLWGIAKETTAQVVESSILSNIPTGQTLGRFVYTPDTDSYYLLDGTKRKISSSMNITWNSQGQANLLTLNSDSLLLSEGDAIDSPIFSVINTPHLYTILDGTS